MVNINNLVERNKIFGVLTLIYYGLHKNNDKFIESTKTYIDSSIDLGLLELTESNDLRLTTAGLYAIDNSYQINRIDFVTLVKRLLKNKEYTDSNKIITLLSLGINIVGRTSDKILSEIVSKLTKQNLERLEKLVRNRLIIIDRGNDLLKDSENI